MRIFKTTVIKTVVMFSLNTKKTPQYFAFNITEQNANLFTVVLNVIRSFPVFSVDQCVFQRSISVEFSQSVRLYRQQWRT